MNSLKAIIFDNDGVLIHTEQKYLELFLETASILNIPYTRNDFIQHTFIEGWGSGGWLEQAGYSKEIMKKFKSTKDSLLEKYLVKIDSAPGASEMLTTLSSKYTLAVASNSPKDLILELYEDIIPADLFTIIISRVDYINPKPAPDAYSAALKNLGVQPSEALVVEDSPRGIASAQAAGIKVVAIKNPAFPELDQSAAEYCINELSELQIFLENL